MEDNFFQQLLQASHILQSKNSIYNINEDIRFYGLFESRPLNTFINTNNMTWIDNIFLYRNLSKIIMTMYNTSQTAGIIFLKPFNGDDKYKAVQWIFKSARILIEYVNEGKTINVTLFIKDLNDNNYQYMQSYNNSSQEFGLFDVLNLINIDTKNSLQQDLFTKHNFKDFNIFYYDMFKEQESQQAQSQQAQSPQVIPSCPTYPVCKKCPQIKFVNKNALTTNMIKVKGGSENNKALYVCSARFLNGSHPGKTWDGYNNCNIGYGGRERIISDFDYLVIE